MRSYGQKVIWFNHWFSAIYNTIKSIKESDLLYHTYIIGSSKNENAVYKNIVDKFYVEPDDTVSDADYVAWLIDVCKRDKVDVLFIKRGMEAVAEVIHLFEALGVTVICDSYKNIKLLNDKAATYYSVVASNMLPKYSCASNYADFKKYLTQYVYKYGKAVVKNVCDEGSQSVRIVSLGASSDTYRKGFTGMNISVEDMLASYNLEGNRKGFHKVMVMEYLTDEVSVDCYIRNEDEEYALPRFKGSKRVQTIKHDEMLEEEALKIGRKLGLKNPYNVQFRKDSDGLYKVLEVNTRMSGGIHLASMCGINIPLMRLYDALGIDYEPIGFSEVQVSQIETAVVI